MELVFKVIDSRRGNVALAPKFSGDLDVESSSCGFEKISLVLGWFNSINVGRR